MSQLKKSMELLFQRPMEPIFTPRDHGKAIFDLPDSFFSKRYSGQSAEIQSRFLKDVEVKIPVVDIDKPNLDFAKSKEDGSFSLFNPADKRVAARLIKMLMDVKDIQQFVALAVYMKDRVNPYLFQYAYGVAVLHRADTADVIVPPHVEQFPGNFIEPRTLREAQNDANLVPHPGNRDPLETPINYTASDREEEQRMAYFREDIGINLHHWHWHMVYPSDGPLDIVNKDRRGELFWYMHHQMLARYNVDRFSNLLGSTKPLSNLRAPMKEGYFPKLLNSIVNRTYASRMPGLTLRDANRTDLSVEVADLERWIHRIQDAIDFGYAIDASGNKVPLDETRGIDILFNIIESTALSVNRRLYGDLHNLGHYLLAIIHDPDARFLETPSVMASVATAMRDPIFYRWHAFIDNLGVKHKALLPPYTVAQMRYEGVVIDEIKVSARKKDSKPNILTTFWQKSEIDLGSGMDFAGPDADSFIRFTHLQHDPFDYTITVTNKASAMRRGTCRIFLLPKVDERSTALSLQEKRLLAIEMDKFVVNLTPGQNRIRRRSEVSSVTIPFEKTFRRIDVERRLTNPTEVAESRFCGCGWPEHMLLPKGDVDGTTFDLFIMISNYQDDEVVQTNNVRDICDDASSFCGLKDKLFPDKRAMGFPFDRVLPVPDFNGLVSEFANMRVRDVTIVFKNNLTEL